MIERPKIDPEKTCSKCKYQTEELIKHPSGQLIEQWVCKHPNSVDPVIGVNIPCNASREQMIFCGHDGRFFEPKTEETNVIQLVKG
jgi:hypothetical protein